MVVVRSVLHKNKLDEFKKWAARKGLKLEETRGEYQVLRIRDENGLHIFYAKHEPTQHISVPSKCMKYVNEFIKEGKS